MKLNPNFLKHKMHDTSLIVPTSEAEFHGLVQGNQTVGDILDCLEHDTTEAQIVDYLSSKYNGDRAIMAEDVASIISRLRKIGAIDD